MKSQTKKLPKIRVMMRGIPDAGIMILISDCLANFRVAGQGWIPGRPPILNISWMVESAGKNTIPGTEFESGKLK